MFYVRLSETNKNINVFIEVTQTRVSVCYSENLLAVNIVTLSGD